MRNLVLFSLTILFLVKPTLADTTTAQDIADSYKRVTDFLLPADKTQKKIKDIEFRFAWSDKAPYQVAVQFANTGYVTHNFTFAIKDLTTNKSLVIDGSKGNSVPETLNEVTYSAIRVAKVEKITDRFMVRVVDENGDEYDSEPLVLKNKK